jgi:hypothetical membrane protein
MFRTGDRPRTSATVTLGLWSGVLAPLLYAGNVAWGGTLFPGYSHIADAISSLTESGRPGTREIALLFGLYNALVVVFGLAGLALTYKDRFWAGCFGLLLATGTLGWLMWPFAMDPVGAPASVPGIIHIILAALASLATMGAILLSALAWRKRPDGGGPSAFSAACLVIVFCSGIPAGFAAANNWPTMGLFERITIGTFLVWMLVTASCFLRGGDTRSKPKPGH